jgi:hypothetical protein
MIDWLKSLFLKTHHEPTREIYLDYIKRKILNEYCNGRDGNLHFDREEYWVYNSALKSLIEDGMMKKSMGQYFLTSKGQEFLKGGHNVEA